MKSCAKFPTEDLSRTTTPWELMSIMIKTPSEHTINGKTFDGEFILKHRGTGIHADRLTFVSILMDASGDTSNWELEKFLRAWSESQQEQYYKCGKYYDSKDCKARGNRRHLRSNNNTATNMFEVDPDQHMYYYYKNQTAPITDRKLIREKYRPYNLIRGRTSEYYYGYEVNLAEPLCTEVVNWRVLATPMKISKYHLKRESIT